MAAKNTLLKGAILASVLGLATSNILQPLEPNAGAGARHWQPVMDWDTDTCYCTAAIDEHGAFNDGTSLISDCRNPDRLWHNNVYVRERCNHGWCVYLYAYYSELDDGWLGHRHDWEHAQVWTREHGIEDIRWTSHGDYHWKWAGDDEVRYEGSHFKLVDHLGGSGTTSLRLAEADDDDVENALGRWEAAWLVDLDRLPGGLVTAALMAHDFGDAHLDLNAGDFERHIEEAMPNRARAEGFNPQEDTPSEHWI